MIAQAGQLHATLLAFANVILFALCLSPALALAQEPPTPQPSPLPPPRARTSEKVAIRAGRLFDSRSDTLKKQQVILIDGARIGSEFSDRVVQRADVQEMIGRVNFYVAPEAESAGYDKMTSLLKIHLKDGRVISGRADFAKGSPANPMTFEEAAAKFRGCAEFAEWPRDKTEKLITYLKALDSVRDVSALSPLLSAEKG